MSHDSTLLLLSEDICLSPLQGTSDDLHIFIGDKTSVEVTFSRLVTAIFVALFF
jgi:hypothetical protein